MIGSDKETEGVRVQVGEALITAKWTDIQSLTITGRDSASTQMIVEIALKNGRNVNARLVRKGKMTITGKADLGAYSLELEKVRKITPVR
jgi:hypothetical protein